MPFNTTLPCKAAKFKFVHSVFVGYSVLLNRSRGTFIKNRQKILRDALIQEYITLHKRPRCLLIFGIF